MVFIFVFQKLLFSGPRARIFLNNFVLQLCIACDSEVEPSVFAHITVGRDI